MRVELVSPEQILYEGESTMVVVRTLNGGDIAFQENHAAFLAALDIWPARVYLPDGSQVAFAVHGGFVEVSNNSVTILSDVAELADEIDVERARRALTAAEDRMRAEQDVEVEAALRRAQVRIELAS